MATYASFYFSYFNSFLPVMFLFLSVFIFGCTKEEEIEDEKNMI